MNGSWLLRCCRWLSVSSLPLISTLAAAQSNLGELLDAGAKRLTAEEFRQELVQRAVAGPTATGGTMEVVYASDGRIVGTGGPLAIPGGVATALVNGTWKTDEEGRVCVKMHIMHSSMSSVALPDRCQYWFRLADAYYLSDSDSDRRMKVLRRTVRN